LLGFAYDGFPIYGAYGYKNTDGSGGVTRIKSSYKLRSITSRTTYADGSSVTAGPTVSTTYPLGYFREDYEYDATAATAPDYLDEHNGRFCVTPEYPAGIYAYFCTVDDQWNSAYPYAVGPTFYGVKNVTKVTSITETVTTYVPPTGIKDLASGLGNITVYPNPASDLIAIQVLDITNENLNCELIDIKGAIVQRTTLYQGSTMAYFDLRTLYNGNYIIRITKGRESLSKQISIQR
jgi:hypothetical protein